jgi:hypothetical protein
VSGLGERRDPDTGRTKLLAVSDRTPLVVRVTAVAEPPFSATAPPELRSSLHEIIGLPPSLAHSQHAEFESVAGDATGRVFIVCESSSQLLVLAADPKIDLLRDV